jgi:hypothetical protein
VTVEAQRTLCILQLDSAVRRANAKCPTLRLRFPMVGSGGKRGGGVVFCAQRTVVVWELITFRKCVKTNKHTKSAFLSPLKMKAFLNQHQPLSDLLMKRHVLVGI